MSLLDAIARMIITTGRACRTLKKAEFFAIGPIGPSARVSRGERALIRIVSEPAATTMLLDLLPRATLPGQLYVLLGLHKCGYANINQLFDAYRDRTDEVVIQAACLRGSRPVCSIVAHIADGTYLLDTHGKSQ